ncbi:MAG: phosphoenolpyruvate--protein phosphotransferase [Pseudomonadota bacterium]
MDGRVELSRVLNGNPVSPGIAIGKALHIDRGKIKVVYEYLMNDGQVQAEIDRFKMAVESTASDLLAIKSDMPEELKEHYPVIDSHLLILKDKMLHDEALKCIAEERINAEWALKKALKKTEAIFERIKDEYIRSRFHDVEFVSERLLSALTGHKLKNLAEIEDNVIVVAHDFSPADTVQMRPGKVMAFLTDIGGRTSHTAIIARSLGIPAVVGLETITSIVSSGDQLIVDGVTGNVIINPTEETLEEYRKKQVQYEDYRLEIVKYSHLWAETMDGYRIKVKANIEFLDEIPSVVEYGAEGIGLLRTEFLYLSQNELPSEEDLFNAYRHALEQISPNPVTIRTLDVGGDKLVSSIKWGSEMNPALGLRAIRFCLRERDIFKTQLRAILRAGHFGDLRIMFPMVSGKQEIIEAKRIMKEAAEELYRERLPFKESVKVGIMIEVPTAAAMADILADEADFFSIGTNDLIQYSLAIDRGNEHVAHLYEPLHPGVLRMVRSVVEAGHRKGIEVAMCEEMAGETSYMPILLGLGLDEISMNPLSIPQAKRIIRMSTMEEAREIVNEVFRFTTAEEIHLYLRTRLAKKFPEEFLWSPSQFVL